MELLRQLSLAEKLQVVEELWDDLAASDEPLPSPKWHQNEARRRLVELDDNPTIAIDRDELWRRLTSRRGESAPTAD